MKAEDRDSRLQNTLDHFADGFRSLILSTTGLDGDLSQDPLPHSSYAPFVQDGDGNFYVFTSGLARHTPNMESTDFVSVFLLEDESRCENIFARKRMTLTCKVKPWPREPEDGFVPGPVFEKKFGVFFQAIFQMPDFRFFRLQPVAGRLVLGFGQAYDVHMENGRLLPGRVKIEGSSANPHMDPAPDK